MTAPDVTRLLGNVWSASFILDVLLVPPLASQAPCSSLFTSFGISLHSPFLPLLTALPLFASAFTCTPQLVPHATHLSNTGLLLCACCLAPLLLLLPVPLSSLALAHSCCHRCQVVEPACCDLLLLPLAPRPCLPPQPVCCNLQQTLLSLPAPQPHLPPQPVCCDLRLTVRAWKPALMADTVREAPHCWQRRNMMRVEESRSSRVSGDLQELQSTYSLM